MVNYVDDLNKSIVDLATEYLRLTTAELDPHTRKKGQIVQEGLNVSLYTPDYIQFAKYGRKPGKKPPLDPILAWVKDKGIRFDGMTSEGTSFAIMASIAKNGTLNWKKDAPNALEEALTKNYAAYNVKLNNNLMVYFTKQTREIYKNIPIQERFTI